MAWAVWITGLPGSGKSTIAKNLLKKLKEKDISSKILRLDEIRKQITPRPRYTESERDYVYGEFIDLGLKKVESGENVILDATAYRKKWRDNARRLIENFIEVYVKCDLETCIKREEKRKEGLVIAKMYRKALERREKGKIFKDLGEVIGIDVPYEENKDAEVIIDSVKINASNAAGVIISEMKKSLIFK